ncbi:hypothetical protein DKX38_023533 [Salix brachista]|uniref:Uncharacterized protein n=1 Tax=Salix brachista TaxID=2182728 RepID=A0A5N5JMV3_9ROSI|nr:hypothetical protein DKX38_023533 [Salix brachista]
MSKCCFSGKGCLGGSRWASTRIQEARLLDRHQAKSPDEDAAREEVEMLVKELMEGGEGEKMREKAMEWKRLAEEAAGPKGTSSINLDKFIHEIISSNN